MQWTRSSAGSKEIIEDENWMVVRVILVRMNIADFIINGRRKDCKINEGIVSTWTNVGGLSTLRKQRS